MDPELKAALEAMQRRSEEQSATIREEIRALGARVDAQGRDIRANMAAMESRLTDSIKERLTDNPTQYDEIEKLKARVSRLEGQVKTLAGSGRKKQ